LFVILGRVNSNSRATLLMAPVRAGRRRRSAEERVRLVVKLLGAALAEARAPDASRSTAKVIAFTSD